MGNSFNSASLNTGALASDSSGSMASSGSNQSGSSGYYLPIWQWLLIVACCCAFKGGLLAALCKPKPKPKKKPTPKAEPKSEPANEPLVEVPLFAQLQPMPVTTASYAAA